MKPDKVNILGKEYRITYCDKPSEVDLYKRKSLWGQVDYWTRTIRIYDNEVEGNDLLQSLLHEIIHAIDEDLKLGIKERDEGEDIIDLLALAFADILTRNDWLKSP